MANWCENIVSISGATGQLEMLSNAASEGRLLSHILPEPENDKVEFGGSPPGSECWNWRVDHWGTRGEIMEEFLFENQIAGGKLLLSFDTAWSPPTGAYRELTNQGLAVSALYYEPGCDFAGTWVNGQAKTIILSECEDSFFRETDLGRKLDGEFGILRERADLIESDRISSTIESEAFQKLIEMVPNLDQWAKDSFPRVLKFQSPGFRDLNMEMVSREGQSVFISLNQLAKNETGNLVPDSKLLIEVGFADHSAHGLSFQDSQTRLNAIENGEQNKRVSDQLNSFLNQWLTNIIKNNFELKSEIEMKHDR